MLIVIYLCVKFSIDPDNVSAPLAAALGDLFVLLIMTLVIWAIESCELCADPLVTTLYPFT